MRSWTVTGPKDLPRISPCIMASSNPVKPGMMPLSEQEARRDQIAQEHGLKVVDGKIPLPDLRIEYETRDHEHTRVDLELATRDYRGHHLAAKGKAGFSIYAPADDASRVRAAVQDPHLISEILSL